MKISDESKSEMKIEDESYSLNNISFMRLRPSEWQNSLSLCLLQVCDEACLQPPPPGNKLL